MVSLVKLFVPVLVFFLAAAADTEETGLISVSPEVGSVIIENVNGYIHLLPGNDPMLQVEWKIVYPDEGDPGRLLVLHDETDGLSVWTEEQGDDCSGAVVDFTVSVPAGSDNEYILETVNGDVEVGDCSGFAMISVVNGNISALDFDGILWLEIVNGEVAFDGCPGIRVAEVVNGEIRGGLGSLDGDLEVSTVNGDIQLVIPEGTAAVLVESLNGSIELVGYGETSVVTELVGSYAEFGEGDYAVEASTVSGDIEVRNTD